MKTNVPLSTFAALVLLMPATGAARNNSNRPVDRGKPRTEHRMTTDRHHFAHVSHRPSMGARFSHRPVHGRYVTLNRERLWLADGVLYRVMHTPTGVVYIVTGYMR